MSSNDDNIDKMANPELNVNGWVEWRKYVLASLDELKKQYVEAEDKIEGNREMFLRAVTSLELSVSKEIGELTTEVKILKTRVTQRALFMAAIIAAIPTIGSVLYTLLKLR